MCELIYFWPKKEQAYFHAIQNVICGVTENRQGKKTGAWLSSVARAG
jgi:hypothetical protein